MDVVLVLFPHAGGSASFYRGWADLLPEGCELWVVQYPGREDRITEPLVPDMTELADAIAAELAPRLGGPYAVFGHSMGSAVAYETVRRLQEGPAGPPVHLFVSGRRVPSRQVRSRVHLLDDDGLVEIIEAMGATPAGILDDPEMRSLVLPVVRNDYRLIETYRPVAVPALDTPTTALAGAEDPTVTPDEVKEWARMTTRGCDIEVLPGGHFFPVHQRARVIETILRALAPHLDG
ncbi:thioesterase II family protein [Nocardiopsis sp. CNR-923]|uniref:thioesterase II family protein n=1 Tax=Nocardiopsis sp. CNR-923 TaxID=1904965 RepID=UPI0021CC76E1|nr:alpha/beta fold hydrolase [Nocardiopsis sp. CNR-923]